MPRRAVFHKELSSNDENHFHTALALAEAGFVVAGVGHGPDMSSVPEKFLEKLAALVPLPRVHLTRFHWVLAPHSKIREKIVTAPIKENSEQGDSFKKFSSRPPFVLGPTVKASLPNRD